MEKYLNNIELELKTIKNYLDKEKLRSKKVYVAHEYGRRHGLRDSELERNTWLSVCVGRELINKGYFPFIPNLYHFVHKDWDDSPDETIYFNLVSSWIYDCGSLLVAREPKWEHSGVHREIIIAESIPIPVYRNLADLPNIRE